MVGFKELLRRLQIQEQMTKQHQTRVDVSENPAFSVTASCSSPHVKKTPDMGIVSSDYRLRNFETEFVVSRTEYTDV